MLRISRRLLPRGVPCVHAVGPLPLPHLFAGLGCRTLCASTVLRNGKFSEPPVHSKGADAPEGAIKDDKHGEKADGKALPDHPLKPENAAAAKDGESHAGAAGAHPYLHLPHLDAKSKHELHELGHSASRAAHAMGEALTIAERMAMRATSIEDRKRFRIIAVVVLLTAGSLVYLLWPRIKSETKQNIVEAAGDILSAKDLQLDASAFAKAVIQQTLSDPAMHALLIRVITEALADKATKDVVNAFVTELLTWLSK